VIEPFTVCVNFLFREVLVGRII